MSKNFDATSVLGEDAPCSRHSRPRTLSGAARRLVGDDRTDWECWADEFEKRLHAAMRSPNRTHGPRCDNPSSK